VYKKGFLFSLKFPSYSETAAKPEGNFLLTFNSKIRKKLQAFATAPEENDLT
jgi:hypothetical protein